MAYLSFSPSMLLLLLLTLLKRTLKHLPADTSLSNVDEYVSISLKAKLSEVFQVDDFLFCQLVDIVISLCLYHRKSIHVLRIHSFSERGKKKSFPTFQRLQKYYKGTTILLKCSYICMKSEINSS